MSQLKKYEKSIVGISQLKDAEIAHNYFDIRVTRADKARTLESETGDDLDTSDFMLKSVYDKNNNNKVDEAEYADVAGSLSDMSDIMLKSEYDKNKDGKIDKAEYADVANKLSDMSDIMLKSEYDPDKDKKVEKAKDADHAHIADKLSDMSDIMLKSEYDKNNDRIVDNSKRWDKSAKYVSPNDPNPALGDDGDFWFQYECS